MRVAQASHETSKFLACNDKYVGGSQPPAFTKQDLSCPCGFSLVWLGVFFGGFVYCFFFSGVLATHLGAVFVLIFTPCAQVLGRWGVEESLLTS